MKKSKLAKFATSNVPSADQLNLKGGIDCQGVIEVLAYLEFNGEHEQHAAVYNQWQSGGIQGCQP